MVAQQLPAGRSRASSCGAPRRRSGSPCGSVVRKSSSTPMPSTVKDGGSCTSSGPSRSPSPPSCARRLSASQLDADQVLLVRDLLRELCGEEEACGDYLAPPIDGGAAGRPVERRVYLDRGVVVSVLGKAGGGRGALGIERAVPVRVGPARGPEVQPRLRRRDTSGGLCEEALLLRGRRCPSQEEGCYHSRAYQDMKGSLPRRRPIAVG